MAIDFPASPTLNDVFTVGNVTYVWDGTKWTASVTGGISLDKIEEGNTSAEVIDTGSDGRFVVTTEGTGRLFVDASGQVSIGSSASGSPLNVSEQGVSGAPVIRFIGNAGNGNYMRGGWFASDNTTQLAQLSVDGTVAMYVGTISSTPVLLTTNNTERLRIDNSGRLGIGTSSPGDALTVQGTGNSYIGLQSATSGYASLKQIVTDTSAWLRTETSHPLYLGTNQTRAITIDTSQRVGIGTATVNRELVLYKASAPAFHIQNSTSGTGVFDGFAFSSIGADATIWNYENGYLRFGTNDTERARIDSSGRLLVGTSTARANLFNSTIAPAIQLEGAGIVPAQRFLSVINNFATAGDGGGVIALGRSKGGTVGSNTVVASGDQLGRFDFQGNDGTEFVTGATIEGYVDGTPGANDMPGRLVFSSTADGASAPTQRMRITSTGAVLIHSGSNFGDTGVSIAPGSGGYYSKTAGTGATSRLRFENDNGQVGEISTSGSTTTYATSSDYRLKENVTAVTDGITRLQQLKPARFNFIADPDKTVDGFLAHEAQAVVPECVTGTKDEVDDENNPVYQGIDQSKLVPLLTAALQEAIAKIETLEGMVAVNNITIDEQQHQLSTLAARLTALESA
jgi:hypothetical protein